MNKEGYKYTDTNRKIVQICKFIFPSLIGVLLFMCPISYNNKITIPIAVLTEWIGVQLESYIEGIIVSLIIIAFLGSTVVKVIKRIVKSPLPKWLLELFDVSMLWYVVRFVAMIFSLLIVFQVGPEIIRSEGTGTMVFYELLTILVSVFLLAGFLLPLLLNFGLLEFFGALLVNVMRPLFGIPGRAAIDAITSWLGDGSIGVMLTSKQYEDGYYTEKEACVIGTNFSLVSITFCLIVVNYVDLAHMFLPFYLIVSFACLVAAIVMPKLPPLRNKGDMYVDGRVLEDENVFYENKDRISYGFSKALEKVASINVGKSIVVDGAKNVIEMWIGVLPVVMTVGTIALVVAEYTNVFQILGLPFVPLLNLLGIPEAVQASQTLFAGFADMLLPSIMISGVQSELTRFVVAAVSVSQLIYLSEVGSLILSSKIPLKLWELFEIFILRTLITLPIIAVIGHILF